MRKKREPKTKETKREKETYIFGKHAVLEALDHTPKALKKIFLAKNILDDEAENKLRAEGVEIFSLTPGYFPKGIDEDAVHQGIVAVIDASKLVRQYRDWIDDVEVTDDTAFVILGELQDPHNVGAVIRSAAAFGISGILLPQHNQAPINGTVVKVSAGMAFSIPLISVSNINTVIRDLKDRGFWIYGLDGDGSQTLHEEDFSKPSVFILGNEAKGIRKRSHELCDISLSIPMHSQCESLNVAASAAVVLHQWSTKHPQALE